MKISRNVLLIIIAGLGVFLIAYSVFRHLTGIGVGEEHEKFMLDFVILAAIGVFFYNRKLAQDEKRAKEAAELEKQKQDEPPVDENLPHWERYKNNDASRDNPQ